MEILRTNGQANIKAFIEKSIGSIIVYSDVPVDAMVNEKIRLFIDRNGHNNIEITKGLVPLKSFILAATYGSDAITSFPANVGEAFETVAVCELCEDGAFEFLGNDKLKIELADLNPLKIYVIDGVEDSDESDDIYMYEEKILTKESKVNDINTKSFDLAVIDDNNAIDTIQYHHKNGTVTDHTRRELRALSQDNDPIAYVKKDGKALTGFVGLIQLPLVDIDKITIKKDDQNTISVLMRHDIELKNLN